MAHPAFTFYQNRMREVYSSANFNAPPKGSPVAKAIQAKMAFAKAAFNHSGVHLWFPDDELGLSGSTCNKGNTDINPFVKQTDHNFYPQPYKGQQLGVLYSHNAQVLYDFSVECNPLADQCTHDACTFSGLGVTEFTGDWALLTGLAQKQYHIVQEINTWEYGNAAGEWHWLLPMALAKTLGLPDFVSI